MTDYKDFLRGLEPGSVDLLFTDPDYGIGKVSKKDWGGGLDVNEFFEVARPLLARHGAIVMFAARGFLADLVVASRAHRLKYYDLVWKKDRTTDHLNARRWPLRNHENIGVFYVKKHAYYPKMWEGKSPHSVGKALGKEGNDSIYGGHTRVQMVTNLKYPRSILEFKAVTNSKVIYPTEKPVDLCKEIIENYTRPGDLVVDCFCGSGSIPVAAKLLGRAHKEFDKSPRAMEITLARLASIDK